MSKNIQKRLSGLQPYVVGLRFHNSQPVVDAIFNEGWALPENNVVKQITSPENPNYYLLYSEKEDIGIDEILDYAEYVINYNIEREKKYELLKIKVGELERLFQQTPLIKLQKLQFTFTKDSLIPDIMPNNIMSEIITPDAKEEPQNGSINLVTPTQLIPEEIIIEDDLDRNITIQTTKSVGRQMELPPRKGKAPKIEEFVAPNLDIDF